MFDVELLGFGQGSPFFVQPNRSEQMTVGLMFVLLTQVELSKALLGQGFILNSVSFTSAIDGERILLNGLDCVTLKIVCLGLKQ